MKASAAALLLALLASAPAHAGLTRDQLAHVSVRPPSGAAEPMDLALTNADTGRASTLARAAAGSPLVLVFADYACATLCGPALAVTGQRLAESGLEPGRDWRLAVVGLQPGSPTAAAGAFADARLPPAVRARTSVLVGDTAAVRRATAAAGYGYVWDAASRRFAHPVAAFVLAPDGRIVRTLSEVALTVPALREALTDARQGRVGSLLQEVALVCHGALEAVGRFDGAILLSLRLAGVATFLALPAFVVGWSRRRRRAA